MYAYKNSLALSCCIGRASVDLKCRDSYPIDVQVDGIEIVVHTRPGRRPVPKPQLRRVTTHVLSGGCLKNIVNVPINLQLTVSTVKPIPPVHMEITVKGIDRCSWLIDIAPNGLEATFIIAECACWTT